MYAFSLVVDRDLLKLRLHTAINRQPISYLGACYIRTKVTKCNREKMTLYFRGVKY